MVDGDVLVVVDVDVVGVGSVDEVVLIGCGDVEIFDDDIVVVVEVDVLEVGVV